MNSNASVIDIILPVYAGLDEVRDCVESVFSCCSQQPFELIVIWDSGPDPQLRDYLLLSKQRFGFTLLENSQNLGFVQTVNRGMRLHQDRDVVLLNSDTLVANDWLDRLLACAATDAGIATVTPFSNNAEICSFPEICIDNELPVGWTTAELDALFATAVTPAAIDIPTGVGFCMLIRRAALSKIGYFDAVAFERGYGEENDFCRRAAREGYRNVHCSNVFVMHFGGVSFAEEKTARVAHAMHLLDQRYPDYHGIVHAFISADPARLYRIQAVLGMLKRSDKPIALIHTHNLGGGTERYVADLQDYLAANIQFLIMRPVTDRQLELCVPQGNLRLYFNLPEEMQLLADFCRQLGVARLHLQHIMGVEASALSLIEQLGLPYDVTLHDYFYINGNPTLSDKDGRFIVPDERFDARCAERYKVPLGLTVGQWRAYTGKILSGAERVIVPSQATEALYSAFFPDLDYQLAYHPEWESEQRYSDVVVPSLGPGEKFRIVVLGALSLEKGADVVDNVAKLAKSEKLPIEVHLVGYAYRPLNQAVVTHGSYLEEDLDSLIKSINPHCAWFPCQWPETYSYTLSACLRLGLPVIAPAVGAFPERLENRPVSHIFPISAAVDDWLLELQHYISEQVAPATGQHFSWPQDDIVKLSSTRFFYRDQYAAAIEAPASQKSEETLDLVTIEQLMANEAAHSASHAGKEGLLELLIKLRALPLARHCARLVPVEWQRKLKRKLSSRPIHEITR